MTFEIHGRWHRMVPRANALVLGLVLGQIALAGGVWAADADQRSVPPAPLSLDDAVAAALAGSPELQAHAAELRAEEARTLQEGLLPNPVLSAEIEDLGAFRRRRGQGRGDSDDGEPGSAGHVVIVLELGRDRVSGLSPDAGWHGMGR